MEVTVWKQIKFAPEKLLGVLLVDLALVATTPVMEHLVDLIIYLIGMDLITSSASGGRHCLDGDLASPEGATIRLRQQHDRIHRG